MRNIIQFIAFLCVLSLPCAVSAQQSKAQGTTPDKNSKAASGSTTLSKGGEELVSSDLLSEQVDLGLDFQERRTVTAGVSTVSGDRMRKNSVANPSLALYGLVPGLIVEDKTGEFGNFSPNFFIRGRGTMGSASNIPLVFVDGFERSMDDLALDDIESVSVLKDASATAIYGMRGANGVILIDTKRGKQGKIRFNVDFEQGFQTAYRIPEFVNSGTFAQLYNQALKNDGLAPKYDQTAIDGYMTGNSTYYPDNQWQKLLVKDMAPSTEANLSASGGNKIARYYVSLGYTHNTGLFDRTDEESDKYTTEAKYDRINFRTNLDIVAIDNLDFKVDVAGMITERNMPKNATDLIWNRLYRYPQHEFPMFLPNGRLGGTAAFPDNPMGYINNSGYRKVQDRFVNTNMSAEYHLQGTLKGLSLGVRYAYDNGWWVRQLYDKTFAVQEVMGQNADGTPIYSSLIGTDKQISYGIGNDNQSRRESFEGFLKYGKVFNNRHNFHATVLYHQDKLATDASEPLGTQYIAGRLSYALDGKYLADVSASYSGSESFAKENRFALFPAVSLGWILSEENFLKDSKAVNFLKLRTSAGIVGNSNLGSDARFSYRYTTSTSSNNYYFGTSPGGLVGRKPGRIANPNMKPEKAFKFDLGGEALLFNSLNVSLNYFFENRYDILINRSAEISSTLGISMANINAGKTYTHGIEAGISYSKQLGTDWSVYSNLNFVWFKDEVKEKMETALPENSTYQYHVGHTIGSNLGLVALGLFQNQEEIDNSPTQMFGHYQPGDIKYKDMNGDGVIDDYDRVYDDGYTIPNMDLGWTLGTSWKNFDVSALFHAQLGKDIYLGDAATLAWTFNGDNYRITQWVADRNPWTPETASISRYPRLSTIGSTNNYRRSSYWMVNGDQVRLRQLEVGYTLPNRVARNIGLAGVRFYLRGMNLFSLDHIKFTDPAALGKDPLLRSYYIGFNVKI